MSERSDRRREVHPRHGDLEVISDLTHGLTPAEIAVVRGRSAAVVRRRLHRARNEMAAKTNAQLVAKCLRRGLIA